MMYLCTGASGTGKSTWATRFARERRLFYLPSVSREVHQEFGVPTEQAKMALHEPHRLELQQALFDRYMEQLELRASMCDLVADRSPLCIAAYQAWYCPNHKDALAQTMLRVTAFYEHYHASIHQFHFTWPPSFEVPDDGFRDASVEKNRFVDDFIGRHLPTLMGMPNLYYAPGHVEQ